MNRSRPAAKMLVAAGLAALIAAQARAVVYLHSRLDAPSPRDANPWIDNLYALLALQQSRFQLFGTLLTAALALATARGSLAPLGAQARNLFIPLALSALAWLLWAISGFPTRSLASNLVGAAGLASGIVIPLIALISFAIRLYRSPDERPAAGLGIIFAGSILVWTLAFAVVQFSIALAM